MDTNLNNHCNLKEKDSVAVKIFEISFLITFLSLLLFFLFANVYELKSLGFLANIFRTIYSCSSLILIISFCVAKKFHSKGVLILFIVSNFLTSLFLRFSIVSLLLLIGFPSQTLVNFMYITLALTVIIALTTLLSAFLGIDERKELDRTTYFIYRVGCIVFFVVYIILVFAQISVISNVFFFLSYWFLHLHKQNRTVLVYEPADEIDNSDQDGDEQNLYNSEEDSIVSHILKTINRKKKNERIRKAKPIRESKPFVPLTARIRESLKGRALVLIFFALTCCSLFFMGWNVKQEYDMLYNIATRVGICILAFATTLCCYLSCKISKKVTISCSIITFISLFVIFVVEFFLSTMLNNNEPYWAWVLLGYLPYTISAIIFMWKAKSAMNAPLLYRIILTVVFSLCTASICIYEFIPLQDKMFGTHLFHDAILFYHIAIVIITFFKLPKKS